MYCLEVEYKCILSLKLSGKLLNILCRMVYEVGWVERWFQGDLQYAIHR